MLLHMCKAVFIKRRASWRSHLFVCLSVCDIVPSPETFDKVSFSFRMGDFHEKFEKIPIVCHAEPQKYLQLFKIINGFSLS